MKTTKKPKISIVAAMNSPLLFQPFFAGESWNGWRSILKAAFCYARSWMKFHFGGMRPALRRMKKYIERSSPVWLPCQAAC